MPRRWPSRSSRDIRGVEILERRWPAVPLHHPPVELLRTDLVSLVPTEKGRSVSRSSQVERDVVSRGGRGGVGVLLVRDGDGTESWLCEAQAEVRPCLCTGGHPYRWLASPTEAPRDEAGTPGGLVDITHLE